MTELPTYTALFDTERRLYAIYDLELPVPVGLSQAGTFLVTAGGLLLVLGLLGVELTAANAWIAVVPPGVVAWLSGQPLAEGRRVHRWLQAQLRHALEPRHLSPRPRPEPPTVELRAVVTLPRR